MRLGHFRKNNSPRLAPETQVYQILEKLVKTTSEREFLDGNYDISLYELLEKTVQEIDEVYQEPEEYALSMLQILRKPSK